MPDYMLCDSQDCKYEGVCFRRASATSLEQPRADLKKEGACVSPNYRLLLPHDYENAPIMRIPMKTLFGKHLGDYLEVKLPKLNIPPEWTLAMQLDKIQEEFDEVKEAMLELNYVEVVKESLDLMQTGATLITMVIGLDPALNFEGFCREHEEKLKRKGYV